MGQAKTGLEALHMILDLRPSVAVVDINMPLMNGITVVEQVTATDSPTAILVLSIHDERVYIQRALAAGARGYLHKRSTGDDLAHAVRAVSSGGLFLDPSVAGRHLGLPDASPGHGSRPPVSASIALTRREQEVVRCIAHGYTSKEVAVQLGINSKSVETHKARAAEKLGIVGRAKLVEYAMMQGWLSETL